MNAYVYILGMWLITAIIRVLPLLVLRHPIKNRFLKSFFHYVPYVTLAVMTFPAIMDASEHRIAGIASLIAGMAAAYLGAGLFPTAIICSVIIFVFELFLR